MYGVIGVLVAVIAVGLYFMFKGAPSCAVSDDTALGEDDGVCACDGVMCDGGRYCWESAPADGDTGGSCRTRSYAEYQKERDRLEQLEADLAQASTDLKTTVRDLEKEQIKTEELTTDVADAREEVEQKVAQLKAAEEDSEEAKAQAAEELKVTIDAASAREQVLADQKTAADAKAKAALEAATASIAAATAEIEAQQTLVQELEGELERAEAENDDLAEELDESKEETEGLVFEMAKRDAAYNGKLKAKSDELLAAKVALQRTQDNLNALKEDAKAAAEQSAKQEAANRARIAELKTDVENADRHIVEMEASASADKETIKKMKNSLAHKQTVILELEGDNKNLNAANDRLTEKIARVQETTGEIHCKFSYSAALNGAAGALSENGLYKATVGDMCPPGTPLCNKGGVCARDCSFDTAEFQACRKYSEGKKLLLPNGITHHFPGPGNDLLSEEKCQTKCLDNKLCGGFDYGEKPDGAKRCRLFETCKRHDRPPGVLPQDGRWTWASHVLDEKNCSREGVTVKSAPAAETKRAATRSSAAVGSPTVGSTTTTTTSSGRRGAFPAAPVGYHLSHPFEAYV